MKALEKLSKWVAAILFVLIAVTLTIFLYDFYIIITRSTKSAVEEHLIQNSRTSATMVRERIQSDLNAVYALSSLISGFEPIDSPEAKLLLKKVGNEFPFSILIVSTSDGKYYTNNGSNINLGETQYLVGATSGDKDISVIYKDALYGRDMIALESPIYQNSTRVGKVSGLYYTNYINNILDNAANGNGHQYQIVDRNGNFILTSGISDFQDHQSLYDLLNHVSFIKKGNKADNVIHDFLNGKPGVASYADKGRVSFLCYMPIGINDWYLISTAPDFGINLRSMTMQNPTVTLALRIIILFIVLILYIVWRQMRYRVAMEKNRIELEILNERLEVKNKTLKLKAENDLLTGLYNKITSEFVISDYLANEGREGRHALFIIDIDDFKKINDEFGHFVGDKALTEAANVIDHCLRTTDIKGRIGGDEFIVLLKNIHSSEDLKLKAAEICNMLKTIQLKEGFAWKLSCSVGAAIYPDHSDKFTDLFLQADKAMYYSKELGKGTYYIYKSDIEN